VESYTAPPHRGVVLPTFQKGGGGLSSITYSYFMAKNLLNNHYLKLNSTFKP